jgi:uncharacterized protein involved in outer membrane biogenesis
MKRFLKFLKYAFFSFILVTGGIGLVLYLTDWGQYKSKLEKKAQSALNGRRVTIGEMRVKNPFSPTLVLENVSVANADAFSANEPLMAQIGKIEASVNLKRLFLGQIAVQKVSVQDVFLSLTKSSDGIKNWEFPELEKTIKTKAPELKSDKKKENRKTPEKTETTSIGDSFVVDRLSIHTVEIQNLLVTYQVLGGKKMSFPFSKISVADLKKISVEGEFFNTPYQLRGQVDSLKKLALQKGDFSFSADLNWQKITVRTKGKMDRSQTPWIVSADVSAFSDDLNLSRFEKVKNFSLQEKLSDFDEKSDSNESLKNSKEPLKKTLFLQKEKVFSSDALSFSLPENIRLTFNVDFKKIVLSKGHSPFFLKMAGNLAFPTASADISSDFLKSKTTLSVAVVESQPRLKENKEFFFKVKADIQDMQLQQGYFDVLKDASGTVSLSADLQAKGNSQASLMASLDGTFLLSGQEISFRFLKNNQIVGSVLDLVKKMIPFDFQKQQTLTLSCAVANLSVHQGKIKIPRTVAVQTPEFNLVLDGSLSLAKEKLDISFIPLSKKGKTTELSGMVSNLVQLKGSFSNPKISFDTKGALNSLTTIGLGVMTSGWSVVGQEVLRQVMDDSNPCQTALKGEKNSSEQEKNQKKSVQKTTKESNFLHQVQKLGTDVLKSIPSFLKGKK